MSEGGGGGGMGTKMPSAKAVAKFSKYKLLKEKKLTLSLIFAGLISWWRTSAGCPGGTGNSPSEEKNMEMKRKRIS